MRNRKLENAVSPSSSSSLSSASSPLLFDKRVTVTFQGELGAYSQKAVYAFFGRKAVKEVVPLPTLKRVFSELCRPNSLLDYAVVPIENSIAGSVGETFDLLFSIENASIIGETSVPVEHCLIVHKDATRDKIRKVMSHPQALAQCSEYLDKNGRDWKQISVYDTAGSVKMIKEQSLKDTAGIASELSAEIYGMKVIARGIEDDHSNTTRFVVIYNSERENPAAKPNEPTGNDKTSVIFVTKHEPGALVRALSTLSFRGINLGKIESRPIRGRSWEYYFYVDFEGHLKEERCRQAIEDLRHQTVELKVLGSYKRAI